MIDCVEATILNRDGTERHWPYLGSGRGSAGAGLGETKKGSKSWDKEVIYPSLPLSHSVTCNKA